MRECLLQWYKTNARKLPWRCTRDPYKIWISETMLQQTRVAAVIPYYERFLQLYPNVEDLANAAEPELLAAWAGLGYYFRARNLQKAARTMSGEFPRTYEAIRALPGVGDYTAAAVSSIAFDLPYAVVDGNVLRVLSRINADPLSISDRKHYFQIAAELLDRDHPGDYNQALMELGATVCTPRNPACPACPVQASCKAFAGNRQSEFPVKAPRKQQVQITRRIYWIERDGAILCRQRPAADKLMPGFWELPESTDLAGARGSIQLATFRHWITFHSYTFDVFIATVPDLIPVEFKWIPIGRLAEMPLSTVFKKAIKVVQKSDHASPLFASDLRAVGVRAGAG